MDMKNTEKSKAQLQEEIEGLKARIKILEKKEEDQLTSSQQLKTEKEFTERRFASLMQQSPSVVEIYDLEGTQIAVNKAYEKLWSFSASTTLFKFNVLKSKEVKKSGLLKYIKEAYKGKTITVPEYSFNPSGKTEAKGVGRVRWLSTKIFPLMNIEKEVANIVITHEDITDRKLAESELENSEKKYRTLFERSNDAIFLLDGNTGKYLDANLAAEKLTGRTIEELKKLSTTEITPKKAKERLKMLSEQNNISDHIEVEYLRPDGSIRYALLDTINLQDKLFYGIAHDITEAKQIEESLRASEVKFRTLSSTTPAGTYITDTEGNCTYANESWLKMTGLKEEVAMGLGWVKALHPEDSENIRTSWYKSQKQRSNWAMEYRFQKPNGDVTWVSGIANPMYDSKKKLKGYIGVNLDITERKEIELALKQSEEQNRSITQTAADAIISTDSDGKIMSWNDAAEKIFGFKNNEIINENLVKIIPTKYQTNHSEGLARLIKSSDQKMMGKTIELSALRKNKSEFPIELSLSSWEVNNQKYYTGIIRDISKRKQAENELKEKSQFIESIVNLSPNILYIYDLEEQKNIYSNEGIQKVLGYSTKEIKELGDEVVSSLMHPDDFDVYINETFPKFLAAKDDEFINHQYRMKDKAGEWHWLDSKEIIYKRNADGTPKQIFGVINDITDRKKTEQELFDSQERLNAFFGNSPVGLVLFDDQYRYVLINEVLQKINGPSMEEHLGKTIDEVLPKAAPVLKPVLDQILTTGEPILNIELSGEVPSRPGEITHYLVSYFPLSFVDNKPTLIGGVVVEITNLKRAEEKITRLSTAVEQSPSVIIITDVNGNFEYTNPQFTEITGYKSHEILGKNVNILKSEIQSKEDYKKLWATINAGGNWRGEFLNKKKDGSFFWEAASISAIYDKHGKITNYIKVAEDITERKETEKALKESEDKYRRLISTSSEGFWLIDAQSKTIDVNHSLCEMLGYKKDEMLNKSPFDFVDGDNLKIFKDQIAKSGSNIHRIYEITLRSKKGLEIPTLINATSIQDKEGNSSGSFAFVTNIVQRKRSEKIQKVLYNISTAIATSDNLNILIEAIRNELGSIIDTTNFYIALHDEESNTFSMPFYTDEKDAVKEFPQGKTLTKYVLKTKKPLLANKKQRTILEKLGEIEKLGTDSKIWLGVPLKFKGKIIGILVVQSYKDEKAYTIADLKMLEFVSDQISISVHRKKAEGELKEALKKATESDRLKSAFLATMSHELRTPLNAIIGFSDIISDDLSPEEIFKFNKNINTSGNHLLNIVEDLFDITLIESGETKLKNKEVNLNQVLHDTHEIIKAELRKNRKENLVLSLINPVENQEFIINTDASKFKQILINLLKNAIKFTAEGYINYGFKIEEPPSPKLIFFVEDTGIGISKSKQEMIFDMFRQVEDSHTRTFGGTGIGLSISKKLTELLGGKIWVDSDLGKGSTFYFSIPLIAVKKAIEPKTSTLKMKNNFRGKTALIVEDDESNHAYLKEVLERMGMKTIWAQNGKKSIKYCAENPDISIVLMDINMPIMNGYQATTEIKKSRPHLPIISQTAYAIAGDREKSLAAGCDDYISKPIEKDDLLKLISQYI